MSRPVIAVHGGEAEVVGYTVERHVSPEEFDAVRREGIAAIVAGDTTPSWVIRETATGRVLFETFEAEVVAKLNTARYEAVPILQYLQEVNRAARAQGAGK